MIRKMIAGNTNTEKEHLLAVNQAMAKQVVKRSKDMAGSNMLLKLSYHRSLTKERMSSGSSKHENNRNFCKLFIVCL